MAYSKLKPLFEGLAQGISGLRSETKNLRMVLAWDTPSRDHTMYRLQYKEYSGVERQNVHGTAMVPAVYLYLDLLVHVNLVFKNLNIDRKGEVKGELDKVAIHFYKNTKLITRLEWDDESNKPEAEHHPQPHWHVAKVEKNNDKDPQFEVTEVEDPSFAPETDLADTPPQINNTVISVDELHLPMRNYDYSEMKDLKNDQVLKEWIKTSIEGFIKEYKYQKNKSNAKKGVK